MKRSSKIAVGIAAALTLGLGTAVNAHQGGPGAGAHAKGGMQQGMKGGMQHSMKGGMGHGAAGHGAGDRGAANQMMTPDERTALREKMRNATPEERQKIADATRAQMQARAQEKGVTLPQHRGPRTGAASGPAAAAQNPTTTEHAH
jgi:hypothetical protein